MGLLEKNKEIMVRLGVYALLMAMNALSSPEIIESLPFDHTQLIYVCGLELVSIVILRSFPDSSLTRDCIDISIYTLLYKAIILEAYFFNPDLYHWLWAFVEKPLMVCLFLVALMRIGWVQPTQAGWDFVNWPAIGVYGWTNPGKVNGGHGWLPLLGILTCATLAMVLADSAFPLTKLASGACGIVTLAFCTRIAVRNFNAAATEAEAREQLIRDYEEELLRVGAEKEKADRGIEVASKPVLTLIINKARADNQSDDDDDDRPAKRNENDI